MFVIAVVGDSSFISIKQPKISPLYPLSLVSFLTCEINQKMHKSKPSGKGVYFLHILNSSVNSITSMK